MQSMTDKEVLELLCKRKEKYNLSLELIESNRLEEANEILLELFDMFEKISNLNLIKVYDFTEKIECFLYCENPQKLTIIQKAPEPVVKYAYQLASIYLEQNNISKAIEYLEKALVFNPVCQYILQELIERYFSIGDYEKAYNYLCVSLENSYTKSQLAFCYKKLGKYFSLKERYDLAIANYSISELYESDIDNKIQIKKITDKVGFIKFNSANELLELFEKEKLNYGPSKKVMETITSFSTYFKHTNDKENAMYLIDIIVKLTNNEEFKSLLK